MYIKQIDYANLILSTEFTVAMLFCKQDRIRIKCKCKPHSMRPNNDFN